MALSATSCTCACYASVSTPLASAHRRRRRRMAPPTLRTDPLQYNSRYRRRWSPHLQLDRCRCSHRRHAPQTATGALLNCFRARSGGCYGTARGLGCASVWSTRGAEARLDVAMATASRPSFRRGYGLWRFTRLVSARPTLSQHASCCTRRYPCQTVSTKACHTMIQKAATPVRCPLLKIMVLFSRDKLKVLSKLQVLNSGPL